MLNPVFTRLVPMLLTITLVGYYFWYLQDLALNVPFQDDALDVLGFVTDVVQADNWGLKLQLFFNQFNDHRTTASRLIYYFAYLVQGETNFRTLSLVANLALPLILGLVYLRIREEKYCWLLLFSVALLLFQLRPYHLVLWTQSAFAFNFVLLYGFFCLYALHRVTTGRLMLAAGFATFASFSLASGQIIWLVGLISLIQQSASSGRLALRPVILWSVIAVVVLLLWHWQMEDLTKKTPNLDLFPDNTLGAPLLEVLVRYVQFFLVLMGSAVSNSSATGATIAGAILMTILVWLSASAYKAKDFRLELCCWYVVLTAAAISWGRGYLLGVDYALTSRYTFPSILVLCMIWVLLVLRIRKSQLFVISLGTVAIALYAYSSFNTYSVLLRQHINERISYYNESKYIVFPVNIGTRMLEATALGVYRPPQRPLPLHPVDGNTIIVDTPR